MVSTHTAPSIDKLVELVGQHIESGSQIKYQLVLEGPDFFMDREKRVVDPPAPPPCPPPWELPQDSTLTILQLRELHTQFYKVAPTGRTIGKCKWGQKAMPLWP